ncbi:hypothetical protein PO909_003659, partial [Leuciscus waleckii]
ERFRFALVNISERFCLCFCLPVDYSWTVYSLRDSLLPALDCFLLGTDLYQMEVKEQRQELKLKIG